MIFVFQIILEGNRVSANVNVRYNEIACRIMKRYKIPTFDISHIILGRYTDINTRGSYDGLHPSTSLNLEIVRILLSVIF